MNEFIKIINDCLNADVYLSESDYIEFISKMKIYLSHARLDGVKGRTEDYFKEKLFELVSILKKIGFTDTEIITIVKSSPELLNITNTLLDKYVLLGSIVKDNIDKADLRKLKIIKKPKDLRISLNTMIKRYIIIRESGYNKFTWNSLVHCSDNEFKSIFIMGDYKKDYQIFEDEVYFDNYYNNIDCSKFDLSVFYNLDCNSHLNNDGKKLS